MFRKKGKQSITRFAPYSLGFHLFLLAITTVSMLMPKRPSNLLMDIEIAGEGELREALENGRSSTLVADEESKEQLKIEIPKEEPKIEGKDIPEALADNDVGQPNEPAASDGEQDIPEAKLPAVPDEKSEQTTELTEEKIDEKIDEKVDEEPIPKELKAEEKAKEEKKAESAKKKQNRKKSADVIKKADKQNKKKRKRNRLGDIANNARNRDERNSMFDKMLADNEKNFTKGSGIRRSGRGTRGNGAGAFGVGNGITESDYEMISSQICAHWVVPSGVRDAANIVVDIKIEVSDNGEVVASGIKILDKRRYASDTVFRAAADSARRAILQASPLSIPREKIGLFREITFHFDLKKALGEKK